MKCPSAYAYILVGERFGQWPWAIKGESVDDVLETFAVLSIESQTKTLLEGLARDEPLIRDE